MITSREISQEAVRSVVIRVIRPKRHARIIILKALLGEAVMKKEAIHARIVVMKAKYFFLF